jgi:hypothetical protein
MSPTRPENIAHTRDTTLEITAALGVAVGGPLYLLTFFIQDNVYGRGNFLHGLSETLGNPTFLTSYFMLLGAMSVTVSGERKLAHPLLMKYPLALPFLEFVVYTTYEVFQAYHPKYIDNNAMDIVMAGLAFVTLQQLYNFLRSFEDEEPAAALPEVYRSKDTGEISENTTTTSC